MANSPRQDVTVVVRSVGERTQAQCLSLILAQGLTEENLVLVTERPFSRALSVGWTAAIAAGRKWTFCIDADVLLRPRAVEVMIAHAERMPAHFAQIQSMMVDKFTFSLRGGGVHLYRTELLNKALTLIPLEGEAIRPETRTLEGLASIGHPSATAPYICGLHDFEQYNRDIFRKGYTHARKHLALIPRIVPLWQDAARADQDFEVILAGAAAGLQDHGAIRIDTEYGGLLLGLERAQLGEKLDLTSAAPDPDSIERSVQRWALHKDIEVRGVPLGAAELASLDERARLGATWIQFLYLRRKLAQLGPLRTLALAAGIGLERLGRKLQR